MLHVWRVDARPFGATQQRELTATAQARHVKRAAGDEQLRLHAGGQIAAYRDDSAATIRQQHQQIERVAEVVVVLLIRADPMHHDMRIGRHEKMKR